VLFRSGIWVVLTVFGIGYVSCQAEHMRSAGLDKAPHGPEDESGHPSSAAHEHVTLAPRHVGILLTLLAGIGVMIWGIGLFKWYVLEIGAIFFAIGLVSAAIARLSPTDTALTFLDGAKDLLSAAIVVGIARGVVVLATDVRILDPALAGIAATLEHVHGVVSVNLMFVFQSLLNFFVPSGSGQAALTMPVMAPLADLIGVPRQVAVLAFQFGDGFSNLIIPTSAVLMGALEAGKVPYERWFSFAWKLQVWLFLLGGTLLSLAYLFGFGTP
jgi:uncharacterized ion transporter superfamily protein YfcC